jgi:predicted metal-binding membrane protein
MGDMAAAQAGSYSRLTTIAGRPRALAVTAVSALTALGWLYLAIIASRQGNFLAALCGPTSPTLTTEALSLTAAMWAAMIFAMMLPSAAPMVLTYAEIAETATRKQESIISPLVLVAGYVVVWLGFAIAATAAQAATSSPTLPSFAPSLLSGAAFIAAGAYQFSSLKHACLRQCRAPFPFFFTNWQTTAPGVFRLGVQQGVYCLGCCWAAMLLMFTVGAMNIVWMAALGALMTAEKLSRGMLLTRLLGVGFIGFGLYLVIVAGVQLG